MTEQTGMRNKDPPPYKESSLCSICQSNPSFYDYVKCRRCIGLYNVCQYCEDVVYSRTRPFSKSCCHIHQISVKMFRSKKN